MTVRVRTEDALKYLHDREYLGKPSSLAGLAGTPEMSRGKAAKLVAQLESLGLIHSDGKVSGSPRRVGSMRYGSFEAIACRSGTWLTGPASNRDSHEKTAQREHSYSLPWKNWIREWDIPATTRTGIRFPRPMGSCRRGRSCANGLGGRSQGGRAYGLTTRTHTIKPIRPLRDAATASATMC